MFRKAFNLRIILKEKCSSDMQFGFKECLSTTECILTILEIISYYNFNCTNVYALFLDTSNAFNRMHCGKLLIELCKQCMSYLVTRVLLYMYSNQNRHVQCMSYLVTRVLLYMYSNQNCHVQCMSYLVTRVLLYMYSNQNCHAQWGDTMSNQFGVLNGVKQGGVLSPLLFAVYINGMIQRLKESGVGCYLSNSYVGGLAFTDDVNMLCPTLSGMQLMYNI